MGPVSRSLSAIALAAVASATAAQSFVHKDWLLVCDNTRTCRAAGYQNEQDDNAVSVLLTRPAGPATAVTAQVMLGSYSDDAPPLPARVTLSLNGKSLGSIAIRKGEGSGDLNADQTRALLAALTGKSEIVLRGGKHEWRVSDQGATAALLKMDDIQGRVGTPSALVRKGAASEDRVLPPLPAPVVQAGRVPATSSADAKLAGLIKPHLKAPADECERLADRDEAPRAWRLSPTQVLVAALCWRAAYNEGYGFWVANDKPPYNPQLVTVKGSDYDDGTIQASHKGRGLGDCWSNEHWTWTGQAFEHTGASGTGLCRLVAAGGAWDMPTRVTQVRPPQ